MAKNRPMRKLSFPIIFRAWLSSHALITRGLAHRVFKAAATPSLFAASALAAGLAKQTALDKFATHLEAIENGSGSSRRSQMSADGLKHGPTPGSFSQC
eukprot:7151261-Pyramimonas_sp.AAC.1